MKHLSIRIAINSLFILLFVFISSVHSTKIMCNLPFVQSKYMMLLLLISLFCSYVWLIHSYICCFITFFASMLLLLKFKQLFRIISQFDDVHYGWLTTTLSLGLLPNLSHFYILKCKLIHCQLLSRIAFIIWGCIYFNISYERTFKLEFGLNKNQKPLF